MFALETALRSMQRMRFHARSKRNTYFCLTAIHLAVLGTFLLALLLPSPDRCLATLIWWTEHYAKIAIVLGSCTIVLFITAATIITIQLLRTVQIDRDERIAATRVVYYLILGVITMVNYYVLR